MNIYGRSCLSFCCLVSIFSNNFIEQNCRCQRDSNSGCQSWRRAHWTLEHPHGPKVPLFALWIKHCKIELTTIQYASSSFVEGDKGICPIVKQIWLLSFMNCLYCYCYCFCISWTQQLTTWDDKSLHLLLAVTIPSLSPNNGNWQHWDKSTYFWNRIFSDECEILIICIFQPKILSMV